MILFRSFVFNVAFYINLIVLMVVFLPVLLLPPARGVRVVHIWARSSLWLLKVIVGTDVEVRGRENIPSGSAVIACKHQSVWETFALIPLIHNFAYILKHELQWLPVFGWYTKKFGMIAVKRGERGRAVRGLVAAARAALNRSHRQIIIFPEGTRRAPGAPPQYKTGAAALYTDVGLTCVPVALNSGLFWPRRKFIRYPGTIVVEFLPPIAPGLQRNAFLATLEERVETASNKLLDEARERFPWVNQQEYI